MAIHKDLTGDEAIHEIMYVQNGDPGAVGAGKFWLDTTGGATLTAGAILKQRDAPDTGWTTRADVKTALDLKAALASPTFTGTPAAPTAAPGTNTTQIATTAFVAAAVVGGGGALVLLDAQTASADASLDFTTGFSSTYDTYLLMVGDIVPATDGANLLLRFSIDGGSSFISSSYQYAIRNFFSDAFDGEDNSTSANGIPVAQALGNNTGEHWNANIWCFNLQGGLYKSVRFDGCGYIANPLSGAQHGMGIYGTASVVDALQLIMSAGNITSGWARLYGVAKA
jgi:hypothetical protein